MKITKLNESADTLLAYEVITNNSNSIFYRKEYTTIFDAARNIEKTLDLVALKNDVYNVEAYIYLIGNTSINKLGYAEVDKNNNITSDGTSSTTMDLLEHALLNYVDKKLNRESTINSETKSTRAKFDITKFKKK